MIENERRDNLDAPSTRGQALIDYAQMQADEAVKVGQPDTPFSLAADSFPGYVILDEIHRGGQGVVYRATRVGSKHAVAIKVLRDAACASPGEIARFEREIEILSELRHPNVVSLHGGGSASGHPYFVMDYISGESLDVYMAGRRLNDERTPTSKADSGKAGSTRSGSSVGSAGSFGVKGTAKLFHKICGAVEAAHLRGVIHRDLKPSNIRIGEHGEPHLLDFGLAKIAPPEPGLGLPSGGMTITGQFVGSLPWASPEQAEGQTGSVDVRTDVYSLGLILFHMLTGEFPYDVAGSARATLQAIVESQPRRPSALRPRLDDDLDTIVIKCLAKDRGQRYQSAGELARDVERYLAGEPIEAKRDSRWYELTKRVRRHRAAVAVLSVVVALSAAYGVSMTQLYQGKAEAERVAEERLTELREETDRLAAMNGLLRGMLNSVSGKPNARDVTFVEALDRADEYIKSSLQDQPLLEADFRIKVGASYRMLSLYDEGARHIAAAVDIRKRELGTTDDATFSAMDLLGQVLSDAESLEAAEEVFRKLLALVRRTDGESHGRPLWIGMHFADVLEKRGKFKEAEALLRNAVDLFRQDPSDNLDNYAGATNNLYLFLDKIGKLDDADVVIREALAVLEPLRGSEHPSVVYRRGCLASILRDKGELPEAERMHRRLLESHDENHGDAKPLMRVVRLHSLGNTLREAGKLDESKSLLSEALELETRFRTSDSRHALDIKSNLALAHLAAGELTEAGRYAREVLETRQRALGMDNVDVYESMYVLGRVLTSAGEISEAEGILVAAMQGLEGVYGKTHRTTLDAVASLGRVYLKSGDTEKAATYCARAVDGAEASLPETHWIIHVFRAGYGACLTASGDFASAERVLLDSMDELDRLLGERHHEALHVIESLVELYDAWDRPEEAARFRQMLQSRRM